MVLRKMEQLRPSKIGFGVSGVKAILKNLKIGLIEEFL